MQKQKTRVEVDVDVDGSMSNAHAQQQKKKTGRRSSQVVIQFMVIFRIRIEFIFYVHNNCTTFISKKELK